MIKFIVRDIVQLTYQKISCDYIYFKVTKALDSKNC